MASEKKTDPNRISGRLDPLLREAVDAMHREFGTSDTTALNEAMRALVIAAHQARAVRFPLTITMAPEETEAVSEGGQGNYPAPNAFTALATRLLRESQVNPGTNPAQHR